MVLKEITESHIEEVKKNLTDAPRAPRTIQYVFTTFGHAWRLANRKGLVSGIIPTAEIKLPKVNNKSGKVSLYELKELLGHQTIQQTERYAHLLPDGIKTAASKFEDIIS